MKVYPNPNVPPSETQAKLIAGLVDRMLTPVKDESGREGMPLLAEDSPEFKALKIKLHPQILGLHPKTTAAAAVVSMMEPRVIAARFGGYPEAVRAGQTLREGAILLYGMQTSVGRFVGVEGSGSAALAEAMVAGLDGYKIFFQFDQWLVRAMPPERMDAVMLRLTERWHGGKDLVTWLLLEHHATWSPALSKRVLETVRKYGADAQYSIWSWGGNGFSDHMHPSCLAEAMEVLKPLTKDKGNAKRWMGKLRARAKEVASGAGGGAAGGTGGGIGDGVRPSA